MLTNAGLTFNTLKVLPLLDEISRFFEVREEIYTHSGEIIVSIVIAPTYDFLLFLIGIKYLFHSSSP